MLRQSSIPSLRDGSIGLGWTGASTKALVEELTTRVRIGRRDESAVCAGSPTAAEKDVKEC